MNTEKGKTHHAFPIFQEHQSTLQANPHSCDEKWDYRSSKPRLSEIAELCS